MTRLSLAAAPARRRPGGRRATRSRVVTTIPDLADMTRQIGGDLVDVTSLATGVEDIHAVPMKPSFAVTLNRADAVVLLGLEAEHAFLPALLEAATQSEDPARHAGLHRRVDVRHAARGPDADRPLPRRPASDGEPAHQPRSRARQGHGAGDRRRALAATTRSTRPTFQAEPRRLSTPSSTPRSPAGSRRPRRSRARSSSATTPT